MAKHLTESNIDGTVQNFIQNHIFEIVKGQMRFENVEILVESGSKEGQSLQGEVKRISFIDLDQSKNDARSTFILKIIPKPFIMRLLKMFDCEVYIYKEILPFFNDIQLFKGIKLNQSGFIEFPRCYGTINEDTTRALFFEDLRMRQFDVIDIRQEELTFEHMSLAMKSLGKLHALSFALKDQQPEKFNQMSRQFSEHFWAMNEQSFVTIFDESFGRFATCLENEKRFDLLDKINNVKGNNSAATMHRLFCGSLAEPYSVICHGDLTTNNSMFRKDENGKAVEIKFLDWQCCRYASPVTDLFAYLLCSTTKELRDKHYGEFLNYYESLTTLLSKLGTNPNDIFPYDALLNQLQKFGAVAVFVGSFLMPMLFADRKKMPSLDGFWAGTDCKKLLLIPEDFKTVYNKRVIDMLDDMARLGYI